MGQFWIGFSNFATSTANKTCMTLQPNVANRFEIIEISGFGTDMSNPPDIEHQFNVGSLDLTQVGSGTSLISEPVDQSSTEEAFAFLPVVMYTSEPGVYSTNAFPIGCFNQRGGMRWSVPVGLGFKYLGEVRASTAGVRVISSSSGGAVDGEMVWVEP